MTLGVSFPVPPNIAGESSPQNVSVLQNRQVTLECKSDAVPPPTLTWLKDDQPVQVNTPACQSYLPCLHSSPNTLLGLFTSRSLTFPLPDILSHHPACTRLPVGVTVGSTPPPISRQTSLRQL